MTETRFVVRDSSADGHETAKFSAIANNYPENFVAFDETNSMLRVRFPAPIESRLMATEYPDDLDGEVLRMIADDGNDMSQPMDAEFHVAAATEEDAEKIAEAAKKLGYEPVIDFDDGSEDDEIEDEITEPWTCTCRKTMLLEYDAIMAAQAELDEIARPLGGYADGWGTFGNVEVEGNGNGDNASE